MKKHAISIIIDHSEGPGNFKTIVQKDQNSYEGHTLTSGTLVYPISE